MKRKYYKEGELNPFNSARSARYDEGIAIVLRVGETHRRSDEIEAILTVEEALLLASRIINDCRMFCTTVALDRDGKYVCTSDDPNNHQGDTCPVHEQ